jgi:salicylate hydroxylase
MEYNAAMRVAVVGGGLGGLAAAGFLLRAGVSEVAVYEQAAALGEVGAGIQVPPNAVRLLRRLGVDAALDEAGVRLHTGWEMRRWQDGSILYAQELGDACERRFDAPYYVCHRAGLLDALRAVLPADVVHLGARCTSAVQEDDQVALEFADGSTARADVVIGADGIHSVLRALVGPPDTPRFSQLAVYRAMVPADRAPAWTLQPGFTVWLGPGRHVVHYPVSGGREVNIAAIVPAGEWRTESWVAEGEVEAFRAEFASWAPELRELIDQADRTWLFALYDREPLGAWAAGRIALLGDAAHPMLPFLAQGAAQAFEDGAALAGCLRGADGAAAPLALRRYERFRLERASEVQRLSRGRPEVNHLEDGLEQRRRDRALAAQDPLDHNGWLYGYDVDAELRGSDEPSPLS